MDLLLNRNLQTNFFIFFIGVALLQYLDSKVILSVMALITILLNYETILQMSSTEYETKQDIKKNDIGEDMYYSRSIHDLLVSMKEYKKYNKPSYKDGVLYMRKFFKTIKLLEKGSVLNKHQHFENANIYLKQSINSFQSITVSLPENNYNDGFKKGNFEQTSDRIILGNLCKELYNECYYILLNMGIEYNKEWNENPTSYTKEIDLNSERIESYNKHDEVNWTLF